MLSHMGQQILTWKISMHMTGNILYAFLSKEWTLHAKWRASAGRSTSGYWAATSDAQCRTDLSIVWT